MTEDQPRRALREDESPTRSAAGAATAAPEPAPPVQQVRQTSPPALAVTT